MIVPFGFYALSAIALGMVIALLTYAGNRKNLTPPPLPSCKPHPYPLSQRERGVWRNTGDKVTRVRVCAHSHFLILFRIRGASECVVQGNGKKVV